MKKTSFVLAVAVGLAGPVAMAQEPAPAHGTPPGGAPPATAPATSEREKQVDLNSASREELMTVPGIGEKEAKKIIAGRPWATKVDLMTKGVLPEGKYAALKNKVVVLDPVAPKAPKK
jgi:DNA uptake protein ComE-like DNA-binding protein